jgi:hypothetical protein
MKLGAFIKREKEGFLIKMSGKLKAAEEVFPLRHFLNGFEIYSKSPKHLSCQKYQTWLKIFPGYEKKSFIASKTGQTISLKCQSDSYFEYCVWLPRYKTFFSVADDAKKS